MGRSSVEATKACLMRAVRATREARPDVRDAVRAGGCAEVRFGGCFVADPGEEGEVCALAAGWLSEGEAAAGELASGTDCACAITGHETTSNQSSTA
jgi:hypothetical protein